jgi:hypothetical protein
MLRARSTVVTLLGVVAGASCAVTHTVRPLGRGNAAINASLGGPVVEVASLDIPTPILSVGGAYGLRDDLEIEAHGDVTAAAFGDLHLDAGLSYHPVIRYGGLVPTLTTIAAAHLLTNLDDTRVAPQLTVAAAWCVGGRHLVYVGGDSGVVIGSPTRVLAGPFVGGEARLGRLGLTLEGKWLAPYYDVAPTAPTWISPGSRGYLSLFLGVTRYLGDVR